MIQFAESGSLDEVRRANGNQGRFLPQVRVSVPEPDKDTKTQRPPPCCPRVFVILCSNTIGFSRVVTVFTIFSATSLVIPSACR